MMRNVLGGYVRCIDRLTHRLGRSLAWLPLLMALLTVAVVVLRYAFNLGSIALQETVMYAHGTLLLLGISYTLKENGHVRVDLIYSRLSVAKRRHINLCGHLLFLLPLCATILWVTWPYVVSSWRVLEGSPEVGGIPGIFLLKTLLPVTAVLVMLQALAEIARLLLASDSSGPSGPGL